MTELPRYSTREIVQDHIGAKWDKSIWGERKFGHNPSWVKASDHDAYVADVSLRLQQLEARVSAYEPSRSALDRAHAIVADLRLTDVSDLEDRLARAIVAVEDDAYRQVQQLEQEKATLQHDIEFKDSLIWTSRESELYKATVAAEKRAQKAEAALAETRDAIQQLQKKYEDVSSRVAQTGVVHGPSVPQGRTE